MNASCRAVSSFTTLFTLHQTAGRVEIEPYVGLHVVVRNTLADAIHLREVILRLRVSLLSQHAHFVEGLPRVEMCPGSKLADADQQGDKSNDPCFAKRQPSPSGLPPAPAPRPPPSPQRLACESSLPACPPYTDLTREVASEIIATGGPTCTQFLPLAFAPYSARSAAARSSREDVPDVRTAHPMLTVTRRSDGSSGEGVGR